MTKFVKHNKGKPRPALLPPQALMAASRVLAHGAIKYSDGNWIKAETRGVYMDATLRHLLQYMAGEDINPDFGELHLSHALCSLLFLLELELRKLGKDDRLKDPVTK